MCRILTLAIIKQCKTMIARKYLPQIIFTYSDIHEVEEGVRDSRQQQQRAPQQHRPLAKKVTHSANTSVKAS
jgi:hypothetical protein